jgi:hypothetical protein
MPAPFVKKQQGDPVSKLKFRTCGTLTVLAAALGAQAAFGASLFGPYTTMATGSWPEAVAIGDVNGDGLNDVVLVTSSYFSPDNDYKLFVFLQDTSGALLPPIRWHLHYAAQDGRYRRCQW